MKPEIQNVIVKVYHQTVSEAFDRKASSLTAHKEGIIAAAMLLAAITGVEDEAAKKEVVAFGLRPTDA